MVIIPPAFTHNRCVIHKVVETLVAEDRLEILGDGADVVRVADVELDDVQDALRRVLQRLQRAGLLGIATRGDDDVVRGLEQLSDKLEANPTGSSAKVLAPTYYPNTQRRRLTP